MVETPQTRYAKSGDVHSAYQIWGKGPVDVIPGRSADVRPPPHSELDATCVMRFPITEASAKIRSLGSVDLPEDVGLPIWAGCVPLSHVAGEPMPADDVPAGIAPPNCAMRYARPTLQKPARQRPRAAVEHG